MIDPTAIIHASGLVDDGASIGARTRVWAFAHVLAGAMIGVDCNICDHTFVEGNVVVGDRVTVKCGVFLWDGVLVEDDVFIGPSAVFTNDLKPRSRKYIDEYPTTVLRKGCSIGANSSILAGVTIGEWAMIGAGSVVTKDVPAYGVVWGSPAHFRYWICKCGNRLEFSESSETVCTCESKYFRDGTETIVKYVA